MSSKQLANGTVGSVEVKGPFEGKFGQFNVHIFDVDGVTFKKFDKKVNLLKSGDEVQLIFETAEDNKGVEFNNVKTLEVVGHSDSAAIVKPTTASPKKASISSAVKPAVKSSSDYAAGAIKGNSVTNGVNIAIASGKPVTVEAILEAAKIVLEVHKLLDEEGK